MSILYRILATLTFFTRLPLWRLCDIPAQYYKQVVPLWPLAGWVTGGVMAAVLLLSSPIQSVGISIILALIARILLTGALHEDGFADFCDGFGGGTTRERTLEIMKDSHIGTYGVLGLITYFFLVYQTLSALLPRLAVTTSLDMWEIGAITIVCVDTIAKYISSTIIYFLPYARKESEAKNKLVYTSVPHVEKIISLLLILPPLLLLPSALYLPVLYGAGMALLAAIFLFMKMHRRIGGYTGDCCGATFIITELIIYFTLNVNIIR